MNKNEQIKNMNSINTVLDKNLAIINLLITYCEANVEEPTSESIFDILVGLNELKNNSNELRKLLFKND